jgi:enterochelin esterase-like enzyme
VRSAGLADTLDAMIRSGWIPPYIAVLPTLGPASWWIDARAVKAETVLVRELIPHIESKYAVQATRSGRALMGASMGGFGALNLSLRYPELFCAAALFMPAVYDPEPAPASAVRNSDQFQKDGKFDFDYWRSLNYPNYLPAYAAAPRKVPMRIVVGDRDELGLDRQAADLHDRLNKLQPRDVELHFVRGAMHSWPGVVKPGLRDGLVFVSKRCASP